MAQQGEKAVEIFQNNDFGNPNRIPLTNPNKKPRLNDEPTVKASLSPKSLF